MLHAAPTLGWSSRDVEEIASGINGSCPEPLGAEGLTGLLQLLYCTVENTVDNGHFCEGERCMTGMNLGNYHVYSHVEEKN